MSQSPSISGQTSLVPVNDCVLVQLDHTDKKEGKYDTRTSGTVIETKAAGFTNKYEVEDIQNLWGKHAYFEEYKEGARIKRDGELFCFIKIEDIRGYEDV